MPHAPSKTGSREIYRTLAGRATVVASAAAVGLQWGCETDSFFDPSRTGYFQNVPTSMPILQRLDVIEPAPVPFGKVGPPEPSDLVATPASYKIGEGDVVKVDIYELIKPNLTESAVRTVDQSGNVRLPILNEIHAAGLTLAQFEEEVVRRTARIIQTPVVHVSLEEGRAFLYTIGGGVAQVGEYKLSRPDFRLRNAIAIAGGVERATVTILVVRGSEDPAAGASGESSQPPEPAIEPQPPVKPTPTIDDLIHQLESQSAAKPPPPEGAQPETPPPPAPAPEAPAPAPETPAPAPETPAPAPAAVRKPMQDGLVAQGKPAPIDIDTLEPVRVSDQAVVAPAGATRSLPATELDNQGAQFVFDVDKQRWVRIDEPTVPEATAGQPPAPKSLQAAMAEGTRIIEVDYVALANGDSSQNVVIRPGDWIFVQPPPVGQFYIGGEIARPGVFNLPPLNDVTLSRAIDAAGGLGPLAIPQRVDLVRMTGRASEATIRVNLAAIRKRTEPDIAMKAGDHVIIGTNFWAMPLAVFRNGFRMTYGFGFLLDRNWGNDVFGPPPTNIVQ